MLLQTVFTPQILKEKKRKKLHMLQVFLLKTGK